MIENMNFGVGWFTLFLILVAYFFLAYSWLSEKKYLLVKDFKIKESMCNMRNIYLCPSHLYLNVDFPVWMYVALLSWLDGHSGLNSISSLLIF